MRRLVPYLLALAACHQEGTAARHQALSVGPPLVVTGAPGDALGTRLARCANGTVIAAAPGRPGAWALDAGVVAVPGDAGAWTEVACVTSSTGVPWLAVAGAGGLLRRTSGSNSWSVLSTEPFTAVAGGRAGAALLAGRESSFVARFDADDAGRVLPDVPGEAAVDTLAWYQDGRGLLIGSSSVSAVAVWTLDAGVPAYSGGLYLLAHFGKALTTGEVSPRAGLESIISSDGEVWIINEQGTTITTLRGATDFGTALAVGPSPYAGLQALWVSEPSSEKIWMFIGDAGTDATPPSTLSLGGFGASLAFSSDSLWIGAPQTAPGGAVVISSIGITPAQNFELRECSPTTCVRAACVGVCVGGVVCDYDACPSDAGTIDGGRVDAGAPDAGRVDAGTPDAGIPDSGTPDAGTPDAGTPDAGTPDSGTPDSGTPDSGTPDSGTPDAGAPDAGAPDAGTPDAGAPDAGAPDAGAPDAGEMDAGAASGDGGSGTEVAVFSSTGCACSTGMQLYAVLLLPLLRRRRGG